MLLPAPVSTRARPETRSPVQCFFIVTARSGTASSNQRYSASGLNLTIAAIVLWNTIYL
jgi:hypothetical protein